MKIQFFGVVLRSTATANLPLRSLQPARLLDQVHERMRCLERSLRTEPARVHWIRAFEVAVFTHRLARSALLRHGRAHFPHTEPEAREPCPPPHLLPHCRLTPSFTAAATSAS